MKTYTIIGGVNGTGKSSLTGSLKAQTNDLGTIIDADRITAKAGVSPLAGGKTAVERLRSCLNRGVCFTQESTLSGHFVPETAKAAVDLGYYVRLYYIGLDHVEECLQRIANRVAHGGHNVDADLVQRRFATRWEALTAVLPYCNEAIFFDNENGFREVAEYQNGELFPFREQPPLWLIELSDYLAEHPFTA